MSTSNTVILAVSGSLELFFLFHILVRCATCWRHIFSFQTYSNFLQQLQLRLSTCCGKLAKNEADAALLQKVHSEIAHIRCTSLRRTFYVFFLLTLTIVVPVQLDALADASTRMPDEAAYLLLFITGLTLLVTMFPSVLTIRSADVIYSLFVVSISLSIIPPFITSLELRVQWSACLYAVRVLTGIFAQRLSVAIFWQTVYLIMIVYSLSTDGGYACATTDASIRTEFVGYIFIVVVLTGLRGTMESKVRLDIQNCMTRSELGAASSLLGMVCDAVVHLDKDLRLVDHSPQLAGLLMRNGKTSMEGLDIFRFMASDADKERIATQLTGLSMAGLLEPTAETTSCLASNGTPITSAFHADLKDASGTTIQAEFFHVVFADVHGQPNHLLGLREYTDIAPLLRSVDTTPTFDESSESSSDSSVVLRSSAMRRSKEDAQLLDTSSETGSESSLVSSRPSAILNAYLEVIASTPEFEQVTGCIDGTSFEKLLYPCADSTDVMEQITDKVVVVVEDNAEIDFPTLKVDGSLFKTKKKALKVDNAELSFFRDDNLGCNCDVGIRVTLQLSPCTPSSNRSKCLNQLVATRRPRMKRSGKGTGPKLLPAGSFAEDQCLKL